MVENNFGEDLKFLKENTEVIVLIDNKTKASIIISAEHQARVLTSSSKSLHGKSYGWINYKLIESKEWQPHIQAFGGEDRFWLAPEAGQYSIYFEPNQEFIFKNWQTPSCIDSEPFEVLNTEEDKAVFRKKISLKNYQNFQFEAQIDRTISILPQHSIEEGLGIKISEGDDFVGFQSENQLTNLGAPWKLNTGLLSIWILGMYKSSSQTTALIPTKSPNEINTRYFGEIKEEKIKFGENYVALTVDGLEKYKIGVLPNHAKNVFGSFDAKNNILTIVKYSLKADGVYLNSLWRNQQNPFIGDAINVYNDGPNDDGSILGPYYELESSSNAKELNKNESIFHLHQTFHFEGSKEELNKISKQVLQIDINQLK